MFDPMFRITRLLAFAGVSILIANTLVRGQAPAPATRRVLWYRSPAPVWDHALPVGNGRLGAMVFGGANSGSNNGDLQDAQKNAALMGGSQSYAGDEHLQLNESSLWQGSRARWKSGKIASLELRATRDGAIRLVMPEGQTASGISGGSETRTIGTSIEVLPVRSYRSDADHAVFGECRRFSIRSLEINRIRLAQRVVPEAITVEVQNGKLAARTESTFD